MSELRITHNQREYVLKHKLITGELIDAVTPIREKMRREGQSRALIQAALESDELFNLIDPQTGDLREGVSQEALITHVRSNRAMLKIFTMPTVDWMTNPVGRSLMAEVMQVTLDRSKFSAELNSDIDSPCRTVVKNVIKKDEDGRDMIDADGVPVLEPVVESETSAFWKTFPVEVMSEYVETFCRRAYR